MTTLCIIGETITFQTASSLLAFYDQDETAHHSQPRRIPILGPRWDGPGRALDLRQCDDLAEEPEEVEGQEAEALQEHQNTCKEVQAHPKPLHSPGFEGRLPLHGVHRVTPE